MPTASLAPDTLISQTNLSGALSTIQDDPDLAIGTDTTWMEAVDNKSNTRVSVGFPTPSGKLTPGATQTLKTKVRKSAALGNSGTVRMELWEAATQLVIGPEVTVSDDIGQVITLTFTDAMLADKTGAGVECDVVGTVSGGSPSSRRVNDVGAVEWDAVYDEAVTNVTGTAIGAGGGTPIATGSKGSSAGAMVAGGGNAASSGSKGAISPSLAAGGGTATAIAAKGFAADVVVAGGGDAVATGSSSTTPAVTAAIVIGGGGTPVPAALKGVATAPQIAGGGAAAVDSRKGSLADVAVAAGGTAVATGTHGAKVVAEVAGGGNGVAGGTKAARAAVASGGGGGANAVGGLDVDGDLGDLIFFRQRVAGPGNLSRHGGS